MTPASPPRKALARDAHEAHRAATPLELLFDLVFVVAIAQAAASLHHSISADHALEAPDLTRKRHHQRPHQVLLHLGTDAPLLQQQRLRLGYQAVHAVMQGTEVPNRFVERARQLLHARVPVHFQRVEITGIPVGRGCGTGKPARTDLGIGLGTELAQLLAESIDRLLQRADEALYQAKTLGRNRVCQATEALHQP